MRAGLLQERITIKRPVVEVNELGEQTTTLTTISTIRARSVVNRQQRENIDGDMAYPSTHTLEVRIYQNIDGYDVVEWNGTQYRIIDITIDKPLQLKRLTIQQIND